MRVLFWGTPEFAVPPLRALLGEGFDVIGVVTQPDKAVGRKRELTPPPVKQVALEEGLPVYQPVTARDETFVSTLDALAPDISVVVAYGQILPKRVIDRPHLGTLNIHASLLPAFRGAAPIQAAIRDGLQETGISIMQMVPALDAGPVILTLAVPVADDETYGELQERLAEVGAQGIVEALALIGLGQAVPVPQDDALATYAPKITRDLARIDWTLPARAVSNKIRAYDPKPGAFAQLFDADLKLFGPSVVDFSVEDIPRHGTPGEILSIAPQFVVSCGDGAVAISHVQPAGKRRMPANEWLRGRPVGVGDLLR